MHNASSEYPKKLTANDIADATWFEKTNNVFSETIIIKILNIITTFFLFLIICPRSAQTAPFQLIESESAVLNDKRNLEIKINYAYEFGYIPVHLNMYRFRYGLFKKFEFGINANIAFFPDQKDVRVSEVGATIKGQIYQSIATNFNLFLYAHYRHAYWGSMWPKIIKDIEISDERTLRYVSPHADEGMDATAGMLMRHSFKIKKKRFYYLIGLDYTYHHPRNYGDFDDNQHSDIRLNFSPELHLAKDKLMMALENQLGYWINRGFYYILVPQIRFEPVQFWCVEIGASIPVVGAENYRIIAGFTYEFNYKHHSRKKTRNEIRNKTKNKYYRRKF